MSRENNTGLWAIIIGFLIFCLGALSMVYLNVDRPIPATISQDVGAPSVEAPAEQAVEPAVVAPAIVTATVTDVTYTVVEGDTLWSIAERELGDAHRWPELWSANADQIENPDLIFPGQTLTIKVVKVSGGDVSADPPSVDPDQGSLDDVGSELPPGSNPLLRELRPDQIPPNVR